MSPPPSLPAAERWPHGIRARYVSGCRCDACKSANRLYARQRARAKVYGRTNGLVDARPVRKHLLALRRAGVGRRGIADAAGVPASTVAKLASGAKHRLREATARRLLAVTAEAAADGTRVPAGPTWALIGELQREGFSKAEIARRLGYVRPALQLGRRRVLASTAQKVERFYRSIMVGG